MGISHKPASLTW